MQESTTPIPWPTLNRCCTFIMGINIAFGGFGTFLNMASIERMSIPIFCDSKRQRESPYVESVCSNLLRNRAGELAVFREGDSVLDIFYKYSALNKFCMHSDWMLGYMIGFYSGGSLNKIWHWGKECQDDPCTLESVACHNQGPNDMIHFHLSHSSVDD